MIWPVPLSVMAPLALVSVTLLVPALIVPVPLRFPGADWPAVMVIALELVVILPICRPSASVTVRLLLALVIRAVSVATLVFSVLALAAVTLSTLAVIRPPLLVLMLPVAALSVTFWPPAVPALTEPVIVRLALLR